MREKRKRIAAGASVIAKMRGNGHRKVLGECERFEETAFLAFQCKDWKKTNSNYKQREETRPANFLDGGNHNSVRRTGSGLPLPNVRASCGFARP
jgi:hypothetical protein